MRIKLVSITSTKRQIRENSYSAIKPVVSFDDDIIWDKNQMITMGAGGTVILSDNTQRTAHETKDFYYKIRKQNQNLNSNVRINHTEATFQNLSAFFQMFQIDCYFTKRQFSQVV